MYFLYFKEINLKIIKSNGRVYMKPLSYRLDNKTFVRNFFWFILFQ